jgi:hypothetical protein
VPRRIGARPVEASRVGKGANGGVGKRGRIAGASGGMHYPGAVANAGVSAPCGGRLRARCPEGEQTDLAQAEQQERVEVPRSAAKAPVQAGLRTVVMPVLYGADRAARLDGLTLPHRGAHREVGRAQATGVDDGHHAAAADLCCEADGAGARRMDTHAGTGGQVDTSMPGQPRLWGWCEPAEHCGTWREGPAPGSGPGPARGDRLGTGLRGGRRRGGREPAERDRENAEKAEDGASKVLRCEEARLRPAGRRGHERQALAGGGGVVATEPDLWTRGGGAQGQAGAYRNRGSPYGLRDGLRGGP